MDGLLLTSVVLVMVPANIFGMDPSLQNCTYYNLTERYGYNFPDDTECRNLNINGQVKLHKCTQCLDITNNNIKQLDLYIFSETTQLSYLNMGNNQIVNLDHNIFNATTKLYFLNISYNYLETLDYRTFWNLTELTYLDLTCNKIVYLPDHRLFSTLGKLVDLRLERNMIMTIDVQLFTNLKSIKFLSLGKNPLNCDCKLRFTMIWCIERDLDTNATCTYQFKSLELSWNVLRSEESCLSSSPTDNHCITCDDLTSASFITATILSFTFGCILTFILMFCKNRMKNSSIQDSPSSDSQKCTQVKIQKEEFVENDFYM